MSEHRPFDYGQESIEVGASRYLEEFQDTTTWAAEVLDGYMLTEVELRFAGHELYGRDGKAMGGIFERGVSKAEAIAASRPNLVFELRRRRKELGEYAEMLAMAKGYLPNTMIVVSDFPEELMDAGRDLDGYNVRRNQTMVRVIIRGANGNLRLISQSLDQSDREGLEAIYALFGEIPAEGELLGQRIHRDLSPEQQQAIAGNVRYVYDEVLERKHPGHRYYAGRIWEAGQAETYQFVMGQRGLVDAFITARSQAGTSQEIDDLQYGFAAAMSDRYELRFTNSGQEPSSSIHVYLNEMNAAAHKAGRLGKVFSGCGSSMASLEDQLKAAGYDNQTSEDTDYSFDKKMYCVVCQKEPKKTDTKKMCGPCGICEKCDKQIRMKEPATKK